MAPKILYICIIFIAVSIGYAERTLQPENDSYQQHLRDDSSGRKLKRKGPGTASLGVLPSLQEVRQHIARWQVGETPTGLAPLPPAIHAGPLGSRSRGGCADASINNGEDSPGTSSKNDTSRRGGSANTARSRGGSSDGGSRKDPDADASSHGIPPSSTNPFPLTTRPLASAPLPPLSPSDVSMRPNVRSGSPLVSLEYRFVFCDVPKVGCTKWKQLFRRLRGVPNWAGRDASGLIREKLIHQEDDATLFRLKRMDLEHADALLTPGSGFVFATAVRDPMERLLSAFLHVCRKTGSGVAPCMPGTHEKMKSKGGGRDGGIKNRMNRASIVDIYRGGKGNRDGALAGSAGGGNRRDGGDTGMSADARSLWVDSASDRALRIHNQGRDRGGGEANPEGGGGGGSSAAAIASQGNPSTVVGSRPRGGGDGGDDDDDDDDSVAAFASTVRRLAQLPPSQWNKHFVPQAYFCDRYKYLPRYDVVARTDADIRHLLARLGLWEQFGATGWGAGGNESMLTFVNAHTQGVRVDAGEGEGEGEGSGGGGGGNEHYNSDSDKNENDKYSGDGIGSTKYSGGEGEGEMSGSDSGDDSDGDGGGGGNGDDGGAGGGGGDDNNTDPSDSLDGGFQDGVNRKGSPQGSGPRNTGRWNHTSMPSHANPIRGNSGSATSSGTSTHGNAATRRVAPGDAGASTNTGAHSLLRKYYSVAVLEQALSVLQVDYELFGLPLPGWALQVRAEGARGGVAPATCGAEGEEEELAKDLSNHHHHHHQQQQQQQQEEEEEGDVLVLLLLLLLLLLFMLLVV